MSVLDKIVNKSAKVCVVGLGYVGLPLTKAIIQAGYTVIGLDTNIEKINKLSKGESYLESISNKEIVSWNDSGKFKATDDMDLVDADVYLICVPTLLDEHRKPDMNPISKTIVRIALNLLDEYPDQQKLIVLESTTYPGTTEEIIEKTLHEFNHSADNCLVAFAPEREDPGRQTHTTGNIPRVVGANTEEARKAAAAFYTNVCGSVHIVSSTKVAEATKLYENIYRLINISYVNEMKVLFDRMDIDIWEVIEAAKTKPFGFSAFYPSAAASGACIPVNPYYLMLKANQHRYFPKVMSAAMQVNEEMPKYVVEKIYQALNSDHKSIADSNILIVGASYKPDIGDLRESAIFPILDTLLDAHANVLYHDTYCPVIKGTPKRPEYEIRSRDLDADALRRIYDCVVILTNHKNVNYQMILDNATLIVDTRNCLSNMSDVQNLYRPTIIKA